MIERNITHKSLHIVDTDAILDRSLCRSMVFEHENWEGIDFRFSSFQNVIFRNCAFVGIDFGHCDFLECEIVDCVFDGCTLYGASVTDSTVSSTFNSSSLPSRIARCHFTAVGDMCSVRSLVADSEFGLTGNKHKGSLNAVESSLTLSLNECEFRGSKLNKTQICGLVKETDFQSTEILSCALNDLRIMSCNLDKSRIKETDMGPMHNTDMRGARLDHVEFEELRLIDLTNSSLIYTTFVEWKDVTLTNADLFGTDIQDRG